MELIAVTTAALVWRESFHPGWKVYADGKEVPFFRADFVNRGNFIKTGKQVLDLEFEYDPLSTAKAMAIFGALLLLIFFFLESKAPRYDMWCPERYTEVQA